MEERVALLELQVVDLNEDVDFLFEEQVIQDERLFNLEVTSDEIEDEVESKEFIIFTASKRSFGKVMFYSCLSLREGCRRDGI